MARHRWIYVNGEAIPVSEDWKPEPQSEYHIMGDIKPYQSMIDGSVITSRSRHREHLRAHGCIEVGNDSSVTNPQYRPPSSPPGLKEKLIQAVNQIESRDRR